MTRIALREGAITALVLSRLLVRRDTRSKRKVKLKTLAQGGQLSFTLDLLC
jgi:hypothetical protein